MKLTNKAIYAFENFLKHRYADVSIFPETIQNALIIEWFDSVGIYISIHYVTFGDYYFNALITNGHITINLRTNSITRTEAITFAILKANEIYNNL